MAPHTPLPRELVVTEDPVTGTWTFTLDGHQIEIERAHGFVKVNGTLHHVPLMQALPDIQALAGEPLDALTHLLPRAPTVQIERQPTRAAPAPPQASPVPDDKASEHKSVKRTEKAKRASTPTLSSTQAQDEERTVLSTEHAAAYLGLSPATLETLRTRGGGPPFLKLGRRVVYRKSDLDSWLAARVRRSTSDPGEQ